VYLADQSTISENQYNITFLIGGADRAALQSLRVFCKSTGGATDVKFEFIENLMF
jgi:hypothetical protein